MLSKLAKMREGINNHKIINYPETNTKIALVALSSKEIIDARQRALEYIEKHPVDEEGADLIFNMFILSRSMRNPDNMNEKFIDSFEELQENSIPKDIYILQKEFLEVQNGKFPKLDEMSVEEFEEIKKYLGQMELKDLDGELQTILKCFHLTLVLKDLLKNN